ncbi:MAG: hypothetical protein FWH53_11395 [Leptospirales bacterium]|nr:hypothetical protein [Leptospirales bacterium]
MNLDEFISEIENLTNDDSIHDLLWLLKEWKNNNKTVLELENTIEKFIDSFWPKENEHELLKILQLLNDFKNENIKNIGGMTMNERLYLFSLLDRFDSCKNDNKKEIIYKKLLANKNI